MSFLAGLYFAGDKLRLSFVWVTPNEAALVLSCLSAALWPIFDQVRSVYLRAAWAILEVTLAVALALTVSRAGVLAYLVALVGHTIVTARLALSSPRSTTLAAALRGGVLVCSAIAYGGARLSPSYALHDDSVLNRMGLWSSAAKCFFDFPSGVGAGNSGLIIRNWYQLDGEDIAWAHVMNTPLQFGIEHGVFLFILCVNIIAALICLPYTTLALTNSRAATGAVKRPDGFLFTWVCHNQLLALMVGVSFGGYLRSLSALVLICVALVSGLYGLSTNRNRVAALGGAFCWGVAVTALICLAIFAVGRSRAAETVHISGDSTSATVSCSPSSRITKVNIFADREVLGALPGRSIRQAVQENVEYGLICKVYYSTSSLSSIATDGVVILCGSAGSAAMWPHGRTILLCPTFEPNCADHGRPVCIFLGALDEDGLNAQWEKWAAGHGVEVAHISDCANNVSSKFGDVLADIIRINIGRSECL